LRGAFRENDTVLPAGSSRQSVISADWVQDKKLKRGSRARAGGNLSSLGEAWPRRGPRNEPVVERGTSATTGRHFVSNPPRRIGRSSRFDPGRWVPRANDRASCAPSGRFMGFASIPGVPLATLGPPPASFSCPSGTSSPRSIGRGGWTTEPRCNHQITALDDHSVLHPRRFADTSPSSRRVFA
jgi:hypothetical protein